MKANKERVRLLVDNLRSGKFDQGRGCLASEVDSAVKYCCLGVACKTAMENGLNVKVRRFSNVDGDIDVIFNDERYHLPRDVANWFGFESNNPTLSFVNETSDDVLEAYMPTSSKANDVDKFTFDQIADAFEANYIQGTSVKLLNTVWRTLSGRPKP